VRLYDSSQLTYRPRVFTAFDTVRHLTLQRKLAQLDTPDHIYNWLADFFNNHSHFTVFGGELSTLLDVTASIIQGSAIGPAAYVVTAGDLVAAVPGHSLCKYADDTYVIIPASNEAFRLVELDNVQRWAEQNNLNLNCSRDSRRQHTAAEPAPLPGIARSRYMKMLSVSIGNDLSVSQHVQWLVTSSAQASYALRVLRTRGLDDAALQHVYRATVVARLTYAASAWRGLARTSDL